MFRILFILNFALVLTSCAQEKMKTYNPLTKEEQKIILQKGTEYPFTGEYNNKKDTGTYLCRQCNAPLYRSSDKFESQCGWPAFDDEFKGAVIHRMDADGKRTEILCANCGAHLGHVFEGENLTSKNIRHCVNSVSLRFVPAIIETTPEKAIFAAGCFWGVEHYLKSSKGVLFTSVGYTGGKTENPTYEEVCSHSTGYAEAVEVFFDPKITSFENLTKLFFEIHDFTQVNRQGPDIGDQYRSEIFYLNENQKIIVDSIIKTLKDKNYKVATKVTLAGIFWKAEGYHQNYYGKTGGQPYCHIRKKIFD